MGKMIEQIALKRGHEIVLIVDENNRKDCSGDQLKKADVAIDFSIPGVALEKWDEVIAYCQAKNGGFFYASNYSVGVNIFFQLNKFLAKMMGSFKDYKVFIEETHHIHKLDAPSGTAITIAEGILDNHPAYHSWKLNEAGKDIPADVLPVTAKRIGEVPGIHSVIYKSSVDEIEIHHSAFSREGFAQGAVLAAEFLNGKKGIYSMEDLLKM